MFFLGSCFVSDQQSAAQSDLTLTMVYLEDDSSEDAGLQ